MTPDETMAMMLGHKNSDLSSFEQFAIADKSSKRASGTSIAAITIGSAALLTGVGAWIFGGVYANQSRKSAEREIDRLAAFQLSDRNERVTNQSLTNKVVLDIATSAGASSSSMATSTAEALALLLSGGNSRGNGQVCPQPVALYQPAMPCACPSCPCNG